MRRLFVPLAAAMLLAAMAIAPISAAPGGVARHQVTTTVYHLLIGNNHTFTIALGCGGVLSASGYQDTSGPDEDLTATLSGDLTYINISSMYVGGWGGAPYAWTGGFPVAGGTGTATESQGAQATYTFPVVILSTAETAYANHGDYVSSMGGGADAAHSCIGMPVVSH